MTSTLIHLCALKDVPEDGSNGFLVKTRKGQFGAIVVRKADKLFVYVNSCPHIGTPLDIKAGEFLNKNRSHILCTTHGALFRIEDGYCISGPCVGANLMALHAVMEKGEVFVSLPEPQRLA